MKRLLGIKTTSVIKNATALLLLLLCSFEMISQDTDKQRLLNILEKNALRAKLDTSKIEAIKTLIDERTELLKVNEDYATLVYNNSIEYVWDKKTSKEEIKKKFNKGLAKILNKEEYFLFFEPIINAIAKNTINEKIAHATETYNLPEKQRKSLKNAIEQMCVEQAFTYVYYKYDPKLDWSYGEKAKLKTDSVFNSTLTNLGYNPIKTQVKIREKEQQFIKDAKAIGLSKEQINSIFELVASQEKKLEDYESNWGKTYSSSVIGFYDPKNNKNTIYADFKKQLSEIISFDQYKKLFKKHLTVRIAKDADKTLNFMKSIYQFSKLQYKSMNALVYKNTFDEISTQEYYGFNNDTLEIKRKTQQIQTITSQKKLLEKQGFTYLGEQKNYAKLKVFLDKLEKAGVSKENKNRILNAINERNMADIEHDLNWSRGNAKNLVSFYFEDSNKEANKQVFRKKLRKLLTKEEFFEIFKNELEPHITSKITKEFNSIDATYLLTPSQQKEIKELLLTRYREEVLSYQYYHFDYGLRDEKVNAAKYKFISKYKAKMESYGF